MKTINLNGSWTIRSECGQYKLKGQVPGSFFQALEESGFWKGGSVFWRDNNRDCASIADRHFLYSREFTVPREFLDGAEQIFLDADGLDTLTEIRINGRRIGKTRNMHRRYHFDVTGELQEGTNTMEIDFRNTLDYIRQRQSERFIWSTTHVSVQGFNRIRKCSSSFGWDWGPVIPDLGIWREISLNALKPARLGDPEIRQSHQGTGDSRKATILVTEPCEGSRREELTLRFTLTHPDGSADTTETAPGQQACFELENPELWWPRGYGAQTLYPLTIQLLHQGRVIDETTYRIGLRTMELDRSRDDHGERFGFRVNGITIFAMGGNIIPQDVYITRGDQAATERLLDSCAAAHFNCIRVWGGGIYPDRHFYDGCDERGLIVWQDLMFACALYEAEDKDFRREISEEVRDNLKRLRHHPSLGLICGNNEMEWAFDEWDHMEWDGRSKAEYTLQYDYLLPEIAQEVCPDVPYWKASPSSGGYFDCPNDPDRGDVHYWDVWHNGAPFTDFRKHHFRFLSEYGFQSFPAFKTVCAYTEEGDRNPFSPVMEDHQRNGNFSGNQQIMKYAAEYFLLGKDMDSHCYISQVSQAEAGRYAVEHLRQNRGRCLGSTYWQVNDNWPTASWSSIDYYGRWKALHYAMKRAYAPVLLSCREEETRAEIFLSTEGLSGFDGSMEWALKSFAGEILHQGERHVSVEPRTAALLHGEDFGALLAGVHRRQRYLSVTLRTAAGETAARVCTCFGRYKTLELPDPALSFELRETEEAWIVALQARGFAKFVELSLASADAVFSDNYFDMDAGEGREISFAKASCADLTRQEIRVRSLFDSY